MDGIINVKKEKGFTSHDVVAKLRGVLHQKKIGHTGTLDPDATGVLPVCIGRATKVCELLTDKRKTYEAVVKLGVVTDTQDMSGSIISEQEVDVTSDMLVQTINRFKGDILQTPPMYSAIKVGGKRLYELARQGIEVERKKRQIHIYSCDMFDCNLDQNEFSIRVECSKGTYIRTLCHDIGQALGCGAAMKSLVRTAVDSFELEEAHTIDEIEHIFKSGEIDSILVSIATVFSNYKKITVAEEGLHYLYNGNDLLQKYCTIEHDIRPSDDEKFRMFDDKNNFYALYRWDDTAKLFKNSKMFFNQPYNV